MRENAAKGERAGSKPAGTGEAPPVKANAPHDDAREGARARAQAAYNAMMGGGEARNSQKRPDYQAPKTLRGRILGRKYGVVFVGLAGVIVLGLWQLEKRYAPPQQQQPVVVDLTKGKGAAPAPADAPPGDNAPPAQPPAADPAPRQGASLSPPIGPNAPAMESAAFSGMPMTGKPRTDSLPVGSIGAPGTAAAAVALRSAAELGDPVAQYELGARYAEGRSVPREPALALDWFQKAARQKFAPAEYRLGGLYERGVGVTRDLAKARDLYLQAAQAGNVRAMHNLAVLSAEGVDGKPDYVVASRWFREAAEHGVRDSQYNLAILYTRGLGIEQNLSQAWIWFGAAAAQGDTDAGKKQIDVGARLDSAQLAAAKAALASFRPKTDDKAANDVSEPQGGWAASVAPEPKRPAAARKVSSL